MLSVPLEAQRFYAVTTEEGIELREGGSKLLFYQVKPRSDNGQYERANYVHPLYGLNGNVLTEDFPEDHPHHRGIFWAWHQVILEGEQVADTWSCDNIVWEIGKTSTKKTRNRIDVIARVVWRSKVRGQDNVSIVQEDVVISGHRAEQNYRLIDFDIHLRPLMDGLRIGGSADAKGYGGFSARIKLPDDIVFTSAGETVEPRETAISAGPWMDFSGSFEGGKAGVTIFCHPSNPGYPEPWILRSARSMENPAFPGRVPVELASQGWRLRYRLVVHDGSLSVADIQHLYDHYSLAR